MFRDTRDTYPTTSLWLKAATAFGGVALVAACAAPKVDANAHKTEDQRQTCVKVSEAGTQTINTGENGTGWDELALKIRGGTDIGEACHTEAIDALMVAAGIHNPDPENPGSIFVPPNKTLLNIPKQLTNSGGQ